MNQLKNFFTSLKREFGRGEEESVKSGGIKKDGTGEKDYGGVHSRI